MDTKVVSQQTIRQQMIEMIIETLNDSLFISLAGKPLILPSGMETLAHQLNELCDEIIREGH